jgi:hypothetical protein
MEDRSNVIDLFRPPTPEQAEEDRMKIGLNVTSDDPTEAEKVEVSSRLYDEAGPDAMLDTYLGDVRGIQKPAVGWSLAWRFHPSVPDAFRLGTHRPALLLLKTTGGLHAIFLDREGRKAAMAKPKKSFGRGGVVVFRAEGKVLLATEGPEDAETLAVALPEAAVICTAGAGTLSRVADHLMPGVERVVLVADADAAGRAGAEKAARAVAYKGIPVAIAMPPEGVKDSNALLQRDGVEAVRTMLDAAVLWQPPADVTAPAARDWPFRSTPQGIEKRIERTDKETGEVRIEWKWFCSPLDITAETRDADGEAWGRLLRVTDRDHRSKDWAMPMAMLAGDGMAYRERLLSLGLILSPGSFARLALHEYISTARPLEKARCVHRIGWHIGNFITTKGAFGGESHG